MQESASNLLTAEVVFVEVRDSYIVGQGRIRLSKWLMDERGKSVNRNDRNQQIGNEPMAASAAANGRIICVPNCGMDHTRKMDGRTWRAFRYQNPRANHGDTRIG